MNQQSVKSVHIKGFKGFEDFYINGVKGVNLIGGKNNVGKTSFMEALQLHLGSKEPLEVATAIIYMLSRRQERLLDRDKVDFDIDIFYKNSGVLSISINDFNLKLSIEDDMVRALNTEDRTVEYISNNDISNYNSDVFDITNDTVLKILFDKEERYISLSQLNRRMPSMFRRRNQDQRKKINFVSSATTDEKQIAIFYGSLVDANREQYLNDSLGLFDDSIHALKQVVTDNGVLLKLATNYQDKPVLLSSFGEGINRYIAVLCAIWASKDGYLFIDEIENGIHYTNYPKLWKLIFEASKLANCQLFITTHSKECIEAFNEHNTQDDGAYFEFYRNQKTGKITAKGRDHEQLGYALTHQGSIRGE